MQPAAYFKPIRQIYSTDTSVPVARYHVKILINFTLSTAKKKDVDTGLDLGVFGNPGSKQQFPSDSTYWYQIKKENVCILILSTMYDNVLRRSNHSCT